MNIQTTFNKDVLKSAVRSANNNSEDICNDGGLGGLIYINMAVVPGADTVTFTLEGKDPLSGAYHTILVSAALVATGLVVLKVYPGLTAAANLVANDIIPRIFRVRATHSAGTPFTYTVNACLAL